MRRFLTLLVGVALLVGVNPGAWASPPSRPCLITGLPALAPGSSLRMKSAAVVISMVDEKSPMQVAGTYVVANPTAQPAAEELALYWAGWEGCAAAPEAKVDGKPARLALQQEEDLLKRMADDWLLAHPHIREAAAGVRPGSQEQVRQLGALIRAETGSQSADSIAEELVWYTATGEAKYTHSMMAMLDPAVVDRLHAGEPVGFRAGAPLAWYALTLEVPPGGKQAVTVTHALPGWSNGPLYSYALSPARAWGTDTALSVEVHTPWNIGLRGVPQLERRDGAYRLRAGESLPDQLMLYPYRPYRLWSWAAILVAVLVATVGGVLWLRRRLRRGRVAKS